MSDILIKLYVPVIDSEYDLFVPGDVRIEQVINLLAKGVADMNNGQYTASGHELLIVRAPDRLLNPALTLRSYGISDGSVLMML